MPEEHKRETEREREIERQRRRQRETNRQAEANRQTNGRTDRQAGRQTKGGGGGSDRQMYKLGKLRAGRTRKQTYEQTDKHNKIFVEVGGKRERDKERGRKGDNSSHISTYT